MTSYVVHTFSGVQVIEADSMKVDNGLIAFIAEGDAPEESRVVKVIAVHHVKEIEERGAIDHDVIGDILNA